MHLPAHARNTPADRPGAPARPTDGDLEGLALAWARHNRRRTDCCGTPPPPDPTRGANRFHRHDRFPDWARASEPVALIGAFVFYRL